MADLTAAVASLRDPETGVAVVVEHSHELGDVTDVTGLTADLLEAIGYGFWASARRAAFALASAILHTDQHDSEEQKRS